MKPSFIPAARKLGAAFYELYAAGQSIDGPLSQEQIREAGDLFHEMLLAYGIHQMLEFEREMPQLSTDELQTLIVSELRHHASAATDDELYFQAGIIAQDIQGPNIY